MVYIKRGYSIVDDNLTYRVDIEETLYSNEKYVTIKRYNDDSLINSVSVNITAIGALADVLEEILENENV